MSRGVLGDGPSFWRAAVEQPDALAFVSPDGARLTFAELAAEVNRASHGLRALGIGEGDVVALCLPNSLEVLVLTLATAQIGVHVVPINRHLTGAEGYYIVGNSGACVVVAADGAMAEAIQSAGPLPEHRYVASGTAPSGWRPLAELAEGQPSELPSDRVAGELMSYTSGTTGRPKGVRKRLTGKSPEEATASLLAVAGLLGIRGPAGAHLLCSPMYHVAPFSFALASLHLGHAVVVHSRFDAETFLRDVERYGITETHMVPTHFHRLLRLPVDVRAGADLSSLRTVLHAGAMCPVHVKAAMIEWVGPILWEYLAATEGGVTMVSSEEWLAHPGTVGRPFPGVRVELLDEDGEPVPVGEAGIIYFSTSIFDFEYHNDPEKTAAARHGDLVTVGDIGRLDEDGYLYVLDRRVDLVVSGGVNIYPAEIEGHLLSHPDVGDVVVFGVPEDEWGSVPIAIVEPADHWTGDEDALAAELLAYCEGGLAKYKKPKRLEIGAVPRTPAGKVLRRRAREEYLSRQGVK